MDHRQDDHSLDLLSHRGNGVLNWDSVVGTVKVIEVDFIDSQPRQRLAESSMNVRSLGVYPHTAPYIRYTTELGSKEDLFALSGLFEPLKSKCGW